jgi:glycosyltransferase involved in cell wall biosynthesis
MPLLFRIFARCLLPRAQLVMPISNYLIHWARTYGAASEKIRVLPHGINVEKFIYPRNIAFTDELSICENKKILSMIGRLSRQKYVYDALEVVRRLISKRDDFMLIFVGDGEERGGLELQIEKEGLSKGAKIVGFQHNETVAAILSKSYLAFCLLAGFSLIEASVSGVPVICYDVEWHADLVKNGETGFIVKEGDLNGLTEAVIYLLDHPDEAREMGARARHIAIERHNLFITSEVKRNWYKELLQNKVS